MGIESLGIAQYSTLQYETSTGETFHRGRWQYYKSNQLSIRRSWTDNELSFVPE
jgi:hypothetical protein